MKHYITRAKPIRVFFCWRFDENLFKLLSWIFILLAHREGFFFWNFLLNSAVKRESFFDFLTEKTFLTSKWCPSGSVDYISKKLLPPQFLCVSFLWSSSVNSATNFQISHITLSPSDEFTDFESFQDPDENLGKHKKLKFRKWKFCAEMVNLLDAAVLRVCTYVCWNLKSQKVLMCENWWVRNADLCCRRCR